jgi:hypothetical protein
MKLKSAVLAGAVIAGLSLMQPAQAQGTPQGSYLRSCTDARIEGDALVATCRTADRREQRTALAGYRRCVGDIGNNNGVLQCSLQGGAQGRGTVLATPGRAAPQPGYAAPRAAEQAPVYGYREGERRSGEPGYGERRYGQPYASEGRERCFEWRREAERLRERLHGTYEPIERAGLCWTATG